MNFLIVLILTELSFKFQFIINSEGFIGLNYEHTTAEGPAIIGIYDHILGFM